jgi:hypothetical protein
MGMNGGLFVRATAEGMRPKAIVPCGIQPLQERKDMSGDRVALGPT